MYLSERNIYGSSRVGMENVNQIIASSDLGNVVINDENGIYNGITNQFNQQIGDKCYESSNLPTTFGVGNVLLIKTSTSKISTVTGTKIETGDRDPRGWYYNIPKGSMDMEGNGPFSSVEIGVQGVIKTSKGGYVKVNAKLKDTGTTQGATDSSVSVNTNLLTPFSVKPSGSASAYIKFNIHENSDGVSTKTKVPIYKFGSFFTIFDSKGVQSFGFDIGYSTSGNKPSVNVSKEIK